MLPNLTRKIRKFVRNIKGPSVWLEFEARRVNVAGTCIYKTIIRPTVTYGCETWVLTTSDENQLCIFEGKILRKIYGPTQNPDGTCRIKTNDELRHRMKQEDIIKFIKSQKTEMGSPCNENGEYRNWQENNRMDAI